MRRRRLPAVLCVAVLAWPATAGSGPCQGDLGGFEPVPYLGPAPGIISVADAYYVDVRSVYARDAAGNSESAANVWLYRETNGTSGLQRGGRASEPLDSVYLIVTGREDIETCQESLTPDELIV